MKSKLIIVLLLLTTKLYAEEVPFYKLFGVTSSSRIGDVNLKALYQNAKFSESPSRISKIDSDDGINSIILQEGYNRIHFKNKTNCRKVFNIIYRKYKGPNTVFNGYEARRKFQTRGWNYNKEMIHLRCYYIGNDKYVEQISFQKKG